MCGSVHAPAVSANHRLTTNPGALRLHDRAYSNTSQKWFFLTSSPHDMYMQEAGGALAELAACRTTLRELSIRGTAQGPDVMAAMAGAYAVAQDTMCCCMSGSLTNATPCFAPSGKGCLMVTAAGFVNLTSLRLRAGWYCIVPSGYVYGGRSRDCCPWSLQHLTPAASGGTRCATARILCS